MEYAYRIPTWENYQHYSKRNPPWIKLHYDTLSSETWVTLDNDSRVLAIACMLIASRHDGMIPKNTSYIKRVAYLDLEPNFQPLIDIGFLVMLADASGCKQLLDQRRDRGETETDYKTIIKKYNSLAEKYDLSKIIKLSDKRKKHLSARMKDGDVIKVLEEIDKSEFLQGKKDWKPDFDWILNPNNFLKIMEGKYRDKKPKSQKQESVKDFDYGDI